MTLRIYDFDGTITNRDSFIEFLKFSTGRKKFYTKLLTLSPFILLYFIKLLPNNKLKEKFITKYFKGYSDERFNVLCDQFAQSVLPVIIRKDARKNIENALAAKDKIIILTASPENYIKPWAENFGIEVIGTQLESKKGKLTGRLSSKNCYGKEKLKRLTEKINLKDFNEILVYGDSRGDKEMLSVGTKKYYRYFKK